MSPFYGIEVRDGQHVVYETTDGIHRTYLPRAVFGSPRKAIAYADMRQAAISPMRGRDEPEVPLRSGVSLPSGSSRPLTRPGKVGNRRPVPIANAGGPADL